MFHSISNIESYSSQPLEILISDFAENFSSHVINEDKKYRGSIYNAVAKKHNVPRGNISRWYKIKDKYYERAGKQEAAMLLGMKAKRVFGVKGYRRLKLNRGLWIKMKLLTFLKKDIYLFIR